MNTLEALVARWDAEAAASAMNALNCDEEDIRARLEGEAETLTACAAELRAALADGGLTFAQLRAANRARLPLFKNGRGEPAHSQPDGSDWALSAWCNAVTGELGELANFIKKIERGDFTLEERHKDVADELADVATYLDILAFRCGVELGDATASKFNRVSDRVGCDVKLPEPPR